MNAGVVLSLTAGGSDGDVDPGRRGCSGRELYARWWDGPA